MIKVLLPHESQKKEPNLDGALVSGSLFILEFDYNLFLRFIVEGK